MSALLGVGSGADGKGMPSANQDANVQLLAIPPGPPPFPLVGNFPHIRDGLHVAMPRLVAQYGGIFQFHPTSGMMPVIPFGLHGGPTIMLSDPVLLEEMYSRPEDFVKNYFKHSLLRRGAAGPGLFTTDDDEEDHDKAARVLLPAFSLNGMREYFNIISECTTALVTLFENSANAGKPVDVHPVLSSYTFEIIGRVCFGHAFNAITNPDGCTFLKNFEAQGKAMARMKTRPFKIGMFAKGLVSGDLFLLQRTQKKALQEIESIINTKKSVLQSCPVSGAAGSACPMKDMAERMLTVPDPGTGELLPERLIRANTMTFLVAGHDSTSTAITMLLYHVATHPSVEERVYREVMDVVGDATLTWDLLGKLPYCTQVVKENLRMFPPAPGFVKGSPPDRATTLGPYHIPPGTDIVVPTFGLHFNPQVYDDPQRFDPDRWSPKQSAKRSPYAWLPFSYGKRACIGMNLSLIEQRVALVEVVRKFHLRVDPSTKIRVEQPLFLNPQGIYLSFTPRSSVHVSAPPPLLPLKSAAVNEPTGVGNIDQLQGKRVVVLFGSNMGTCEHFADCLVQQSVELGLEAKKEPLDMLASESTPELPTGNTGLVLIVTATYNGQPPENAKRFAAWLGTSAAKMFHGVRYAVFGCGNRQWAATYMGFAQCVQDSLEDLGAECLIEMGEGDMDGGQVEVEFARWCLKWKVALLQAHGIDVPASLVDGLYPRLPQVEAFVWHGRCAQDLTEAYRDSVFTSKSAKSKFFQEAGAWFANAVVNRELLQQEGRSTKHIELPLPDGIQYKAGDHLGVVGANPHDIISAYLARVQLAPDAVVKLEGESVSDLPLNTPLPAYFALAYFVELQQLATRTQLHQLAKWAEGAAGNRLRELASLEGGTYEQHVLAGRRTLLEVLKEVPDLQITFGQLLALLPAMKPRYYSISSSPKASPSKASITVSVVRGTSPSGRVHIGLCSNFLSAQPKSMPPAMGIDVAMPLMVFVKDTGSAFRLPATTHPVIMVGPGTGLAPMRGFIQDRIADGAKDNLLFFGCRDEKDFLYREELEAWVQSGCLELHTAFSRLPGCPKVYVQHLIEQQQARVVHLIAQGAYIYVCGDASQMAPQVRQTFIQICSSSAGLGPDFIDKMIEQGRYCQDVWAAQSW